MSTLTAPIKGCEWRNISCALSLKVKGTLTMLKMCWVGYRFCTSWSLNNESIFKELEEEEERNYVLCCLLLPRALKQYFWTWAEKQKLDLSLKPLRFWAARWPGESAPSGQAVSQHRRFTLQTSLIQCAETQHTPHRKCNTASLFQSMI